MSLQPLRALCPPSEEARPAAANIIWVLSVGQPLVSWEGPEPSLLASRISGDFFFSKHKSLRATVSVNFHPPQITKAPQSARNTAALFPLVWPSS